MKNKLIKIFVFITLLTSCVVIRQRGIEKSSLSNRKVDIKTIGALLKDNGLGNFRYSIVKTNLISNKDSTLGLYYLKTDNYSQREYVKSCKNRIDGFQVLSLNIPIIVLKDTIIINYSNAEVYVGRKTKQSEEQVCDSLFIINELNNLFSLEQVNTLMSEFSKGIILELYTPNYIF